MVRRAALPVRPGGIVAFHEAAIHLSFKDNVLPCISLVETIDDCLSNSEFWVRC